MPDTVQIEVDRDIFDFLRSQVQGFRETESSVLRRLLGLQGSARNGGEAPLATGPASPLDEFLAGPKLRLKRNATDKFLAILAFAHEENSDRFERLLEISGRRRRYFGRSQREIVNSGKSTHPQQIPGTNFWVMTNADTFQKRDILRKALRALGYSDGQARAAARVVE